MTIRCLILIVTSEGADYAEVQANDLHQLAILMPGSVIEYDVQTIVEQPLSRNVIDEDLYAELEATVSAISRGSNTL